MCHPAEVLKNDKVERRKEAGKAVQSKGTSTLALAIFQGKQTQSPVSGHRHDHRPQLQAQRPRSHRLQREVSEEQWVTLGMPEPLTPNPS